MSNAFGINVNIQLNDADILNLEKVINWAKNMAGRRMSIDQFTKDLEEKINHAGFTCEVKVLETNEEELYGFEVEINGRTFGEFDPDQMIHEVTSNLLQLPGQQEGFIKTKDAAAKLLNRDIGKGKH